MARGPKNEPIPRHVILPLPWDELLERLTAVAIFRLRGRQEDARQLALEATRNFLDPSSTVVWDYRAQPDPARCLGSILNGLIRNYFRVKSTNSEVATDPQTLELSSQDQGKSVEEEIIERDYLEAILKRVSLKAEGDPIVSRLVDLARDGLLEIEEQMGRLSVSKSELYEARRRFRALLEIARKELEDLDVHKST